MKHKILITGIVVLVLTLIVGIVIHLSHATDSSDEEEQYTDTSDYRDEELETEEIELNTETEEVVLSTETEASDLPSSESTQVDENPSTEDKPWILNTDTRIFMVNTVNSYATDENLQAQIRLFDAELAAKVTKTTLPIAYGEVEKAGSADIILILDNNLSIPEQGYQVAVKDANITISASDDDGLFYGCRYLIQQLLLNGAVTEKQDKPAVLERAISLDIGRKYFSPEQIERLIKEMSWSNMNALVLHFSEEMGLGLESKTYPWLAGRDGTLCVSEEITTDSRYLTQEELREIAKVAKLYHVELIPAFDSPGHMNYIVKKYNEHYGVSGLEGIGNYYHYDGKTAIVQGSRNTEYSRGIDISNAKAVAFTQDLIKEYAALFKELGSTKFDIGGDELLGWGASIDSAVPKWQQLDHWKTYAINQTGNHNAVAYDGFLLYMNDLYTLLSSEPYSYTSVRMWNDDALRTYDTGYTGVVTLDKNIEIQYWMDTANNSRNSVHTFLQEGYKVYNFINTYNYYAMLMGYYEGTSFPKTNQESIYNNWNPYVFDESSSVLGSGRNVTVGDAGIKGSTLCVWCDNPSLRTDVQVVTELIPLIRANGTKAWDYDANSTVSYSTFLNNVATIGDVPTVSITQSQ